ncbi:MAG: DUF3786 domain-containing protein [Desulfobacteraceae bacterium]|nr:DUF3786 domain-containing protein [Desulfobacteraceae bacterium]
MESCQVFDEKFKECMSEFQKFTFSPGKADILGVRIIDQSFVINFFNQKIFISKQGMIDAEKGDLTPAVMVVLLKYLLLCPDHRETTNKLVTFREFSNAGPLVSSFTTNTAKIVETTFSGNLTKLKHQCTRLGGTIVENPSHDMSVRFRALHRIPIILNFNDRDETLPANASFLYHDNADSYLDLESLMVTCTYLTGLLIQDS